MSEGSATGLEVDARRSVPLPIPYHLYRSLYVRVGSLSFSLNLSERRLLGTRVGVACVVLPCPFPAVRAAIVPSPFADFHGVLVMVSSPEGRVASPAGPSLAQVVVASTGVAPGRPGAVAPPWNMPQPFQRARGSRGSTSSVELIPMVWGSRPTIGRLTATPGRKMVAYSVRRPSKEACLRETFLVSLL